MSHQILLTGFSQERLESISAHWFLFTLLCYIFNLSKIKHVSAVKSCLTLSFLRSNEFFKGWRTSVNLLEQTEFWYWSRVELAASDTASLLLVCFWRDGVNYFLESSTWNCVGTILKIAILMFKILTEIRIWSIRGEETLWADATCSPKLKQLAFVSKLLQLLLLE